PRKKTLFGTAKAMLHLSVVLPPKFADPTTIISAYPSFPGACGSISPLVGKTNLGRATLVYHPSTVPGSCTLVAEEAFTGAKSHKVVIRQKAP
ncbi:MAG TPA: hypothetical protein VGZ03_09425, partial [Acidimicrobiales bacterium]|nr:hypothetical protein [Acidimicrobiales bacterium]